MINAILLRLAGLSYVNALVFAGAAGVLFYWSPFYDDGSRVQSEIGGLRSRVSQEASRAVESEQALRVVEQTRKNVTALQEQFKVVTQQLPTELQMSEVVRSVDTLARTSGVSIKDKEPLNPVRQDFLDLVPLRFKAEGSFSELTMFIYYLSSTQRIARVRSFTLSSISGKEKDGRLGFDGELVSYRFIPEAVSTEAGTEKKK